MTKQRDPLAAAQAEIERRSRVMRDAARFSPYGRPERDEAPPMEGGAVPNDATEALPAYRGQTGRP